MAYRKIMIAVDCNSDEEQVAMQNIAKEISGTFRMSAKDIIGFYPLVKKNQALLYSAIKVIAKEGKKGLVKIIPMLMKKL